MRRELQSNWLRILNRSLARWSDARHTAVRFFDVPGLWQLHGNAGNGASFSVMAVASVRVAADRAAGRITIRRDGAGLVLSEDGGCKRTARLARG